MIDKLNEISDKLKKNAGDWDLTNDDGVPFIIDHEKNLLIPDLLLNKDGTPCAVIPLSYFSDDTILWINENM